MPIGTSGQWGRGMKQSALGVRRLKVKVIREQDRYEDLVDVLFSTPFDQVSTLFL